MQTSVRYIFAQQRDVCYILYEIADNDYRLHMRMNHVPLPQKETLGYYFQSGTCLVALETHDLQRCLQSVVCKWHVINVTLLTLKVATQNTRLMGYFPILLMKLFELYMFELDLNTNLRHLWSVFLLVRVTYVTFLMKLHILTL